MPSQNKILLKQTLLLLLISALFYLLGSISNKFDVLIGYEIYYFYLFLTLLFFVPISLFYLLRIKKNINLKALNIFFKIFAYLLSGLLLLLFVFGIYYTFRPIYGKEFGYLFALWFHIKWQITDLTLLELFFQTYLPSLIFAGLLYWTVRINKFFTEIK